MWLLHVGHVCVCVCILWPFYCSLCKVHTLRLCRGSAEPAAKFYILSTNLHYLLLMLWDCTVICLQLSYYQHVD